MTGFMAGRFGNVFGEAIAELGGEDESRGVAVPAEGIEVGDPACSGSVPVVAAANCVGAFAVNAC
jgi:hypothetical protein